MLSFDQFCDSVDDSEKADLIAGVICCAPSDSFTENRLMGFVGMLIDGFMAAQNLDGIVLTAKYAFKLDEFNGIQPDVAYVAPERSHLVGDEYMEGGPDIAIEIVSRDSVQRDYGEKRDLYEAAGVEEYWIVDPRQQRVQFLRLKNGRYELAPLEENRIFKSSVIPGFWLDVNWLLARPIPKAYHCLEEILASRAKPTRKRKR